MIHLYEKGKHDYTLLLLHGTGGDEHDLLPLAKHIDSKANLLSVRGNVLEQGMPRFFKRLSPGVFDRDSLKVETKNLHVFMAEAAQKYGFDPHKVIAIGYSNGANIASSVLLHFDAPFYGAILFRPMVPITDLKPSRLKDIPVLIVAGTDDPIVAHSEINALKRLLMQCGAHVDLQWVSSGHNLTTKEIMNARTWYESITR